MRSNRGSPAGAAADRLGQGPDQDHRSRQQDLHAGRAGRQHHRRGRHRRHHHGGQPVRAALRQDQGRHQGDLAAADQVPDQHPLSTAITPAETRTSRRTAPPSWRRTTSGSASRPARPAALTGTKAAARPAGGAAEGDLFRRLDHGRGRRPQGACSPTSTTPTPTATPGCISPTPTCSRTGDIMNNLNRYQQVDFANGGDIRGMIRATDAWLKVANDNTKVVAGHGPLANKADVVEYRDMLMTARERIEKLFNEGKTEAGGDRARSRSPISTPPGPTIRSTQSATRATSTIRSSGCSCGAQVFGSFGS